MKFTEEKLEQVCIELLEKQGYPHVLGSVPVNKSLMRESYC